MKSRENVSREREQSIYTNRAESQGIHYISYKQKTKFQVSRAVMMLKNIYTLAHLNPCKNDVYLNLIISGNQADSMRC